MFSILRKQEKRDVKLPEGLTKSEKRQVQKIVDHLIQSKQLEYADITLKDLDIVKSVFVEKLINLYHARVPYPEDEDKK